MRTLGKIIGVVVVVLALALLGGAAMLTFGRFGLIGRMMGRGLYGGFGTRGFIPFGFGFGLLGPLFSLLLFGLLIVALITFIVSVVRGERPAPSAVPVAAPDAPMQVLRERYARGEITKEQYDTIKHDLETT